MPKRFVRAISFAHIALAISANPACAVAADFSSKIACQIQLSSEQTGIQVGDRIHYQLAAVSKTPIVKLTVNGEVRDLEEPSPFMLTGGRVNTFATGKFQIQATVSDGSHEASCASPEVDVDPLPVCTPPQVPVTQQISYVFTEYRLVPVSMQAIKSQVSCVNP